MDINKFLEIELKYDLNQKSVRGVNYWNYNRFKLWNYDICANEFGLNTHYLKNTKSVRKLIYRLSYFFQKRKVPRNVDVLILNHERRVKNGEFYDCAYTESINKIFNKCATIEEPFQNMHYTPVRTKNLIYVDHIIAASSLYWRYIELFHKSQFMKCAVEIKSQIYEAVLEINDSYNSDINIDSFVYKLTKTVFMNNYIKKRYSKIIAKMNPKVIVEVVYYGQSKMIINELAKENHIPIIELQHGTIYREHIAYQYCAKGLIKQFPDEVLLFSDYWKKNINAPIPEDKIRVVGYPFFEEKVSRYSNMTKEDNRFTILFISQGTIGVQLSQLAYDLSEKLPKEFYRVIFKLHPAEYANWKQDYEWLEDSSMEIVCGNEKSIYEYFSQSDIQIGVYSTAIFEGLGFGLHTLIERVGHYEIMDSLVKDGYATYIDSSEDIIDYISNNIGREVRQATDFWKHDSLKNMRKEIESIMKEKTL